MAPARSQIIAPDGFLEAAVAENVHGRHGDEPARQLHVRRPAAARPARARSAPASARRISARHGHADPADRRDHRRPARSETIDGLTYRVPARARHRGAVGDALVHRGDAGARPPRTATHTLHNTYSLRGAKIRDPQPGRKYLNETLDRWGDKAEVLFAQHHWPTWGNERVARHLASSATSTASSTTRPCACQPRLHAGRDRRACSSCRRASRTTWHTARLLRHGQPRRRRRPTSALPRLVRRQPGQPLHAAAGRGREALRRVHGRRRRGAGRRPQESYDKGEYRWVAEVVNHVVFADPDNQAARGSAGRRAGAARLPGRGGTWRNLYLTGAQELRKGVAQLPSPNTRAPTPCAR